MPEQQYIQGFKTIDGLAKYDYNALANLPLVAKVLLCTWSTLPNPSEQLNGTIALVQDENQYDKPLICFQRGENIYSWVAFDGSYSFSMQQIETPTISVMEE